VVSRGDAVQKGTRHISKQECGRNVLFGGRIRGPQRNLRGEGISLHSGVSRKDVEAPFHMSKFEGGGS